MLRQPRSALHNTRTINLGSIQTSVTAQTDRHIQGDSRRNCNTLRNDSMCDSKQKSSYKHGSDFGRLRSYDRLKLRIEGNDY